MTKRMLFVGWVIGLLFFSGSTHRAAAKDNVEVVVKTIQASSESGYLDPRLSPLIEELQSVFRYSSYRLLSEDAMTLRKGQIGRVGLPGSRVLRITPKGLANGRIALKLQISKGGKQIFQTQVQLLNRGSIIVGGPQHGAGTLLFRIFAAH